MSALVFPASLRSVVEGAVQNVIAQHQAGRLPDFAYDRTEAGELEVVIRPAEAPEVVVDFDKLRIESQPLSRTEKARRILGIPVTENAGVPPDGVMLVSRVDDGADFRTQVLGVRVVGQAPYASRFHTPESDEQPIAAHGVAEEDGA